MNNGDGVSTREVVGVAVDDAGDVGACHGHCCSSLPLSSLWVLLLVVVSNCAGGGSRWEVCTRS